jgi:hypothetical protein
MHKVVSEGKIFIIDLDEPSAETEWRKRGE